MERKIAVIANITQAMLPAGTRLEVLKGPLSGRRNSTAKGNGLESRKCREWMAAIRNGTTHGFSAKKFRMPQGAG